MAGGEDTDSGMGSMPDSSKDVTPEKTRTASLEDDDTDDESLGERLWGLTEMFPEKVRNASSSLCNNTVKGLQCMYSLSRSSLWIFFSTSAILLAPVLFEVERAQVEEAQKTQQKQVLLGPNTAMAGASMH